MTVKLSDAIRQAAKRAGLTVEQFRRKKRLPNTTFYCLLRDELPAKVETREDWRKRLQAAGVTVPSSAWSKIAA
jgi:hypothetical protein